MSISVYQGIGSPGGGYGRTRRPKSVTSDGQRVADAADGLNAAQALTALNDGNDVAARRARGNRTENQRFLHITTGAAGTVDNVWVFSNATGFWAQLMEPLNQAAAITQAADIYRIIEIDGADFVAFSITGADVWAAVSTF